MPYIDADFEHYALFQYAKLDAENSPPSMQAEITCFDSSSNAVAILRFYRTDVAYNSYIEDRGLLILSFSIERFQEIITTLRYEKPLSVTINTDIDGNVLNAYLRTREDHEPVGEQEGAGAPPA